MSGGPSDRAPRRHFEFPQSSVEARIAAAGLAAIIVFLFRKTVFGQGVLFIRDINMVWLPQVETFVRCVASGSWPLWDPYRGFGAPLLADPRAEVLYPPTWLNLLLPPGAYYTCFVVSHLLLGGLGMRALARRWQLSAAASFVAAAIWTASGPFLSLASVWHHLAGAAWMPWVLVAGDRALRSGARRDVLVWGAVGAVQVLAGSPDMTVLTGVAVLVHVAVMRPIAPRMILPAAGALGCALAWSAAQWIPTLDATSGSARQEISSAERTTWSLHPLALPELLVPFHWSDLPPRKADLDTLRELQAPWLQSIHLGIPAAALAAAALAEAPAGGRAFSLVLGAIGLLLSLGRHGRVGEALLLVPPLRLLRFPVKAMVLVALSWSLLAGAGFDAWRRGLPSRRWAPAVIVPLAVVLVAALAGLPWLARTADLAPLVPAVAWSAALSAAMIALALARRRGSSSAPAVVAAGLALGELLVAHRNLHPVAPADLFRIRPEVLDVLERSGHPRLYVADYSIGTRRQQQTGPGWMKGYPLARVPVGWTNAQALVLGVHMYLNPPTAARWGLYGSYDLDILGFYPRPLRDLTERLRDVEDSPLHLRLLQMGAVANALALHPAPWWRNLVPVAEVPSLFAMPIHVFRVPDALPRSWVVGRTTAADGAPALQALTAPGFDPRTTVVLPSTAAPLANDTFTGVSRILELKPDRVRLEVEADHPGYVVMADAFDPGWRATVDGRSAPVMAANVAFRAVPVPAGRHLVEEVYRPPAVYAGAILSLAGIAAGVAAAVGGRKR